MHDQEIAFALNTSDIPFLAGVVGLVAWSLTERCFQVLRLRQPKSPDRERLSWYLCSLLGYGAIIFSVFDAVVLRLTTLGPGLSLVRYAGIPLVVAGILIRIVARWTLGRQFSGHVQTTAGHRLVTSGIYRSIRHPAYLGYLCLLIGFPLCFGSLGGLACTAVAGIPAIIYRLRIEERELGKWFGDEYAQYMTHTARLVPGLW